MNNEKINEAVDKARERWEDIYEKKDLERILKMLRESLKQFDTVEEGLKEYRSMITGIDSYKSVARFVPLVAMFGGIPDHVALSVCGHMEPLLNQQPEYDCVPQYVCQAMIDESGKRGKEYYNEFIRLLAGYETMSVAYAELVTHQQAYTIAVETMRLYVQSYLTLREVGSYREAVGKAVPDERKSALDEAEEELDKFLNIFRKVGAVISNDDGEEWSEGMREELLRMTTKYAVKANTLLSGLKGYIAAFRKWIADNKAEGVVPFVLRFSIENRKKLAGAGGFADHVLKKFADEISHVATEGNAKAGELFLTDYESTATDEYTEQIAAISIQSKYETILKRYQ